MTARLTVVLENFVAYRCYSQRMRVTGRTCLGCRYLKCFLEISPCSTLSSMGKFMDRMSRIWFLGMVNSAPSRNMNRTVSPMMLNPSSRIWNGAPSSINTVLVCGVELRDILLPKWCTATLIICTLSPMLMLLDVFMWFLHIFHCIDCVSSVIVRSRLCQEPSGAWWRVDLVMVPVTHTRRYASEQSASAMDTMGGLRYFCSETHLYVKINRSFELTALRKLSILSNSSILLYNFAAAGTHGFHRLSLSHEIQQEYEWTICRAILWVTARCYNTNRGCAKCCNLHYLFQYAML